MTHPNAFKAALFASAMLSAPAFAGSPHHTGYTPDLVPSNPVAGECYARVKIPAQYETVTEAVVTKEAHTKMHVQQPTLAARQEQIMVKEPSVRYQVRQPTYKTITETLVTRPAYDKLSVTPPTFQTVTETIQTSAPRLVWKKGNPGELMRQGYVIHSTADGGRLNTSGVGQGYSSTTQYAQSGGDRCGPMCEIWCLVEEPGESVSVSRQVMSSPGQVQRTRVPEVRQRISKQVVADPGGVDEIPVPAEYRTVTIEDIVDPGGEALIEVPAEYGQVQGKRLVAEERYEWRRVLCQPGTGTLGGGHSNSSYSSSTTSYSAPTYSQPTYAAPAAPVVTGSGYYGVDDTTAYESGKYCRDKDCGASGYGHSGTGHSGQSYSGQSYSGQTYSGMGYGDSSPYFSSGSTLNTNPPVADRLPEPGAAYSDRYESGRHFRKRHRR